jgi:hypothetical protein
MFKQLRYLLVFFICLSLVISLLSCWKVQEPYSSKANGVSGEETSNKSFELQLEKAPRLNEPVELICISQPEPVSTKTTHEEIMLEFKRIDPKTYRIVKVQQEDVLVSGSFNWEGDMAGEPLRFSAIIKFPYEGNWSIDAYSSYHWAGSDSVLLNVAEDSASFGWLEDYRPHLLEKLVNDRFPIYIGLDIPEVPGIDQPVELTWFVGTVRDITQVSGEVQFKLMQDTDAIEIPTENILLSGDLTWKGDLTKGAAVERMAVIKFPTRGDWEVSAICNAPEEDGRLQFNWASLFFHIDKDKSKWGWMEPHEKPFHGPPPPAISPDGTLIPAN